MRVMHLSGSARGGAELQLLHLLQTASERGSRDEHSVLLVRPGPLEGAFDEVAPTVVSAKSHAVDLRFIRDVIRQILRERPDVVHSWGPTPNLWGPVLTRIAQLSPRGLRLRLHPRVIMAEVGLDEWKGRLLKAADRLCYRLADRIVGNAAGVTEAAIRRGADPEKADTVLLGAHIPPRDQLPQAADAQPLAHGLLHVESSGLRSLQRKQRPEVCPAQLSSQRDDNLLVRELLGKLDHAAEVLLLVRAPVPLHQLSSQRDDNLLPVSGSLRTEHLIADKAAKPPEGQRESQVGLTSSRSLPLLDHPRRASEQVSLCLPAAPSDLSHR